MITSRRAGPLSGAWVIGLGLVLAGGAPATAGQQRGQPKLCATKPAPPSGGADARRSHARQAVTSGSEVWSFRSAPRLHPMKVTVLTPHAHTAPGQIFTGPYSAGTMVGQTGALMTDNAGNPVFFHPLRSASLQDEDFQVQTYPATPARRPQRVLTWWQGTIAVPPTYTNLPPGAPEPGGCWYILDSHYHLLQTIQPKNGWDADEHEFLLTPRGTALFIASRTVKRDLTPYGGPKDGSIEDSEVQEVDLTTGKLLFTWDILKHVSPALSEVPAANASVPGNGGVWDAYHMNSIDEGPGGQLLISARNMWAVYDVFKPTGRISWQLGGKRSGFTFAAGAKFYWQHDVRFRPGNRIAMFDDGCCNLIPPGNPEQQSHGLILSLNLSARIAVQDQSYYHQPPLTTPSQGNMQPLSNGDEFVGWGQTAYYSEYAAAGNSQGHGRQSLRYDAKMPGSNISYRAYRYPWTGSPFYPPQIAAASSGRRTTVYASWNGSTQTSAWQVLAGPRPGALHLVVARAARTGFETRVTTAAPGPYFQVRALNTAGQVLRASRVLRASGVARRSGS